MPTGYTCIVDDGATFGQYVWRCARAFGALITMRDSPMGAPIPLKIEPDQYYSDAVDRARLECSRLESMSDDDADIAAREEFDRLVVSLSESAAQNERELTRNRNMRHQVEAWKPPSNAHAALKTFMLEQLETGKPYEDRDAPPQLLDGPTWRARRLIEARRNLAYSEESKIKHERLCAERTKWLQQLNESVPYEDQPNGSPS